MLRFFVEAPEMASDTFSALRSIDAQIGWINHFALVQAENIRSDVKRRAIFVLAGNKVKEAAPHMMNLIENDNQEVRCAAIIGLGDLKANQAIPLLARMIRNKECDVDNRASAVVLLSKIAGDHAETYLSEFVNSDEERVSKAARWKLADYRNRAVQEQTTTGSAFVIKERKNGIFRIAEEQRSDSLGYFVEIAQNGKRVYKGFTIAGRIIELHLPSGEYECSIRCFLLDRLYSAYWEGAVAGLCDESQETRLSVRWSDVEEISLQGTAVRSIALASLLQESEQFVDTLFFLIGTLGRLPDVEPLWGPSTRQDWVLSQDGQSVFVMNSLIHRYLRHEGKQIAVLAELKRSALEGGYRLVSVADWLIEGQ